MATAELTIISKVVETTVEEKVVQLTLTKREAAMLTALSGYIPYYDSDDSQKELYALLKAAGAEFGMHYYDAGQRELGLKIEGSPNLKFVELPKVARF